MISESFWTVAEGLSAWDDHPKARRNGASPALSFIYPSFKSAPQAIKRCTETNWLLLSQMIKYKRTLGKERGFSFMPATLARGRALAVFLAVFAVAYLLQDRSKGVKTPLCPRKRAAKCCEELGSARLCVSEPSSRSRQTSPVERRCGRLVPREEAQELGSVPRGG